MGNESFFQFFNIAPTNFFHVDQKVSQPQSVVQGFSQVPYFGLGQKKKKKKLFALLTANEIRDTITK